MASLLSALDELFGTRDLYQVLGLLKPSNQAQIRKAYHRVSLKVHPDRVEPEQRDTATKQFQALAAVYKILSDQEAKAAYDDTGFVDNEPFNDQDQDWEQYWRALFPKLSTEDISKFEATYRASGEEDQDLKAAYLKSQGDMDFILDNVLCSTIDDEPRFAQTIRGWIASGEVPDFKKFSKETNASKLRRKKRMGAEASEAKALAADLGLDEAKGTGSLVSAIMRNQTNRQKQADNFLDQLALKYGAPEKKRRKK